MLIIPVAILLFLICLNGQPVYSLSLSIMYEFDSHPLKLVPNDDGSSPEISIRTTFPYFDKNHNSLYVNTNGAISFERGVSQYTPQPFPLGDNRILIAPFWADVDIRRRGKVSYSEISNPEYLERATRDIRGAFSEQQRFTPTWLFVATWNKVPFYDDTNKNGSITNTFQLVLVTNGRHSFVIFNYEEIQWTTGTASGGNSSGLGGREAECGFNAGDGLNYFSITRSNQSTLLALPSTSNVGRPGVWIFRIDKAKIENGGCNTKGFLTFPQGNKVSMHGGANFEVAGPCFDAKNIVLCKFDNQAATPGKIVRKESGNNRVRCTAPMVNHTKRATLKVSINNGIFFPFQGLFQYVRIDEVIPIRGKTKITLVNSTKWQENSEEEITWNPRALGTMSIKVKVQIARYTFENNAAKFHSFFDLCNQSNSGISNFSIPQHEGKGLSDPGGNGRFVSFIRVIKETLYETMEKSSHEWIWSDVITWDLHQNDTTNCKIWYKIQLDPKLYTEKSDLLACPPTCEKALMDIGRYEIYNMKGPISNAEGTKCLRTIVPSNRSTGQECCYNIKSGNLIIERPNSGKFVRVHAKSGIPFISNYFHDVLPHQDCCRSSSISRHCVRFYEKRPPDNGKKYEPPRPAVTVGEPHLITLDGVQYTFNGIGEYHILKIMSNGFTLQGRMEQMQPVNNTQINATVYTAFALTETGSDIIQINLNGRGFVDIFVNAENVDFDREDLFEFSNGFILKSFNASSYSVIFNSGICVTVEEYPDLLQSRIIVPEKYKGKTSGLFGFWDDDKENEFLLPNGTFLNTTSSPEAIHYDFGLKWATKNNESLFFYPNGKNHSSFYKPDFVPEFLDYRNLTFEDHNLESKARTICGESLQCLFDIRMTGKTSIGLSSQKSLEEFREIVKVTERKDCLPIDPVLENGVTQRNDSEEGILVYYFRCTSHYVLNGSKVIMCKDGVWNGTKPRCIECVLENPNLIAQVIEKTNHEITYQLYCKNGYNRNGPNSLKCIRGKWTGDQPKCIKNCLPIDPVLENGVTQRKYSEEGILVYYFRCTSHYVLNGSEVIMCKDGVWNGTKPRCIENQAKEEISTLIIALISVGCALFLVIMVIIRGGLVKRKTKRKRINGRETTGHHVEGDVDLGEQNKVMMLSFLNLEDSFESTKG